MKQGNSLLGRTLKSAVWGGGAWTHPFPQTPPPQGPLSHGLWTWMREAAHFLVDLFWILSFGNGVLDGGLMLSRGATERRKVHDCFLIP